MARLPLSKHPILYYRNKWYHHRAKYGKVPDGIVVERVNGINFPFDFALGKIIKGMYFGSCEFEIRRLMKQYLKPGGVFLDIGANVGYLSAVGAGLVCQEGQVHSFEPVPAYFRYLQHVAELNPGHRIVVNNSALGESTRQSRIVKSKRNLGGSSMIPDFVPEGETEEVLSVQVQRLDEYVQTKGLSNISLIKIDTEGFELPVLLGASRFFNEQNRSLPPVIVEITPRAFELMNRGIGELEEFMSGYGYKAYAVCGWHRIDITKITNQVEVLFKV